MPPKSKKREREAPETPEETESKRLKKLACRRNILQTTQFTDVPENGIPKALMKYDGANINNKSSSRGKSRFLFVFPGKLDVKNTGGKFGTLDNVMSKNPILYVEYPQGRIKMHGTIVYPKSRLLAVNYKPKSTEKQIAKVGLQCRGMFDAFIVFSEYYWVGKPEDNPSEKKLEFPSGFLKEDQLEKEAPKKELPEVLVIEDDDEEPEEPKVAEPVSKRRSGRKLAVQKSYKEISDDEDEEPEEENEDDSEDEDNDDGANDGDNEHSENEDSPDDKGESEDEVEVLPTRRSGRSGPKKSYKIESESDDEVMDEEDSEYDGD